MKPLSEAEIKAFRTYNNYVLVLPDKDYEKFQRGGKDTGLYTITHEGNAGENVSVKGTVYAVPDALIYNGRQIESLKSNIEDANEGTERQEYYQKMIDRLKSESVLYDVPIEISNNDRVAFYYKNHFDATKQGLTIPTVMGDMIMMKYDTLMYTVDSEDKFLKMLNGHLLVDMIENVETKTDGGIILPDITTHSHFTKRPKYGYGRIKSAGCNVEGYLEAPRVRDGRHFEYEKVILFDPRYARNMEHDLHQVTFDKRYYRMHRKDVLGFVMDGEVVSEITNFKPY